MTSPGAGPASVAGLRKKIISLLVLLAVAGALVLLDRVGRGDGATAAPGAGVAGRVSSPTQGGAATSASSRTPDGAVPSARTASGRVPAQRSPGGAPNPTAVPTRLGGAHDIDDSLRQKAFHVIDVVDRTGAEPAGYVGGRQFMNDGRGGTAALPRTSRGSPITYHEYDVNPYRRGVDRGPQRVVMGDDGSAWVTGDHYVSWERLR